MDRCPQCGLKFSDPSLTPSACPNCGEPLESELMAPGSRFGSNPIAAYFRKIWMILTQPSAFFRSMPVRGGIGAPLAFALITHWLGSAASFLWWLLVGGALGGYVERFFRVAGDIADIDSPGRGNQIMELTHRVQEWVWGVGPVIIDPFFTLLRILFISFIVFLGARILVTPGKNGAPREITFESALRIICYGFTPSILGVLPLFGGFVASLYVVFVTIIGARETYRIDNGRATVVALFPQILLLTVVLLALVAVLVAMLKFLATGF